MENRYFKGKGQITKAIESVIVGSEEEQRKPSKSGYKIVKLPIGDTENHDCLKTWQELTHEELIKEFQSEDWTTKFPF